MGFIGQNGAGKTTTIRSLLHITNIDEGEIRLLGLDHIKDETDIKKRIAVVFDELPFHDIFNAKDIRTGGCFRLSYPNHGYFLSVYGAPAKNNHSVRYGYSLFTHSFLHASRSDFRGWNSSRYSTWTDNGIFAYVSICPAYKKRKTV